MGLLHKWEKRYYDFLERSWNCKWIFISDFRSDALITNLIKMCCWNVRNASKKIIWFKKLKNNVSWLKRWYTQICRRKIQKQPDFSMNWCKTVNNFWNFYLKIIKSIHQFRKIVLICVYSFYCKFTCNTYYNNNLHSTI